MYTVMLVDDEDRIVSGLQKLIAWEDFGLEVIATANDGARAWDEFVKAPCDILITDIRMPHVDGLALLDRVCALDPHTKCVVISGYDEFGYIKQALQYGIENYILKPIDEEELSATLLSAIAKLDSERRVNRIARYGVETMRENLNSRWTVGSMDIGEITSRAELVGIDPSAAWYAVATACLREDIPADCPLPVRQWKGCAVYGASTPPRQVTMLLCGQDAALPGQEDIHALRERLRGLLPTCTGIGMGHVVRRAEDVPASFRTAQRLLRWSAILPGEEGETMRDWFRVHPVLPEDERVREVCGRLRRTLQARDDMDTVEAALSECGRLCAAMDTTAEKMLLLDALVTLLDEEGAGHITAALAGARPSVETVGKALHTVVLRQASSKHADTSTSPTVEAIYRYIDEHYREDISLKLLGASLHFNPAYLGQLFKQHSGQLFLDYLCAYRIEKAKRLLADSTHRSGDIARMVGFRNANYFANVFRKITGVYPTVYRKRQFAGWRTRE